MIAFIGRYFYVSRIPGAMAKKVKAEDAATPVFKFPEFDEKEYIREEIRDSKAIIASALVALPMALVAALMTASIHPTAGIVMGLAGFGAIYFLFKFLFMDVSVFKVKHWLMSMGGYFLTFLALWILLINPPFMDLSSPVIEKPQYDTHFTGNYTAVQNNLIDLPDGTSNWMVRVRVADNVGLAGSPQISVAGGAAAYMTPVPGMRSVYEASVNGIGTVVVTATDTNGHTTTFTIDAY